MEIIELGGGETPYIRPNVDVRPGPSVDIVADLNKPLPLESDKYDIVFCRYAIEHISWRNVKGFITEVFRICKPGGKATVITANLLEQCKMIAKSEAWSENFSCMIFGDLNYDENSHKCGFSPEYAKLLFTDAGFSTVVVTPVPGCKTDMVITAYKAM
jgi:ubiquinone/menaquinone biosynthesis C-methylase UbiE